MLIYKICATYKNKNKLILLNRKFSRAYNLRRKFPNLLVQKNLLEYTFLVLHAKLRLVCYFILKSTPSNSHIRNWLRIDSSIAPHAMLLLLYVEFDNLAHKSRLTRAACKGVEVETLDT